MPKSKDQKRKEAAERNQYWRGLTRDQKIDVLRDRPGRNLKQLKKLGCI